MPKLSLWFLRLAMIDLLLGFTFGALILMAKAFPAWNWAWALFPLHIELLLYGWTLQLAMGVAFWILPRFSRAPKRGNVRLAWAALVLINAGLLLAVVGALLAWNETGRWVAVLEAAAALTFALHAWPRVKPLGADG